MFPARFARDGQTVQVRSQALVEAPQVLQIHVRRGNVPAAQLRKRRRIFNMLFNDSVNHHESIIMKRAPQSMRVQVLPSNASTSLAPIDHSTPSLVLRR